MNLSTPPMSSSDRSSGADAADAVLILRRKPLSVMVKLALSGLLLGAASGVTAQTPTTGSDAAVVEEVLVPVVYAQPGGLGEQR